MPDTAFTCGKKASAAAAPSTPVISGGKGISHAYGEFLASWYPWQWFCTFTSAKPTHPEALLKAGFHWLHKLDRQLEGRRPKPASRTVCCFAVERHKSGQPHMHAILYHHRDLNHIAMRRDWQKVWHEEMQMGFAKVEAPQSAERAARYCGKYLAKEGELYFSDSFGIHLVQHNLTH